jgi:hypothetical protein
MKTPKEKALDMVNSLHHILKKYDWIEYDMIKEIALQNVDEICEAINWHEFESPNKEWEYWNNVKLEIQKL